MWIPCHRVGSKINKWCEREALHAGLRLLRLHGPQNFALQGAALFPNMKQALKCAAFLCIDMAGLAMHSLAGSLLQSSSEGMHAASMVVKEPCTVPGITGLRVLTLATDAQSPG